MFLSNGFNAYISKPIDIMQLDVALNTWVRNKQSKETLLQAEMEQAVRAEENTQNISGVLDGLLVDGIDLILGKERYNNESAYLEILRSYYIHTPALLKKLGTLSNKSDTLSPAEYTVVIHGLKGSSYGICANAIGKEAEELEAAARAGDFNKVLKENGPFIEQVGLMLTDLGILLRRASEGRGNKQKSSAPDRALLEKLLDSVKHYKSTAMEEILAELESYEYESGGELITWLREQMDNLEYDSIRARLEKGR
jgi:hypothetical protein